MTLMRVSKSKDTNSGNKRRPRLSRRQDYEKGVVNNRKNIQRPLIKSVRRIKKPKDSRA